MSTTAWVILIFIILLLIVVAVVLLNMRRRQQRERSDQLQERFGPEYDRAVDEHGNKRKAESKLADVADRRDKLEIRELDPDQRRRYEQDWTGVQADFVDNPARATSDADRLVGAVMRDRGYPVDDFETKTDMVAVDHPQIAENYRAAHAIGERANSGGCETDELRQGFLHYRALFEELLRERAGGDGRVQPSA